MFSANKGLGERGEGVHLWKEANTGRVVCLNQPRKQNKMIVTIIHFALHNESCRECYIYSCQTT